MSKFCFSRQDDGTDYRKCPFFSRAPGDVPTTISVCEHAIKGNPTTAYNLLYYDEWLWAWPSSSMLQHVNSSWLSDWTSVMRIMRPLAATGVNLGQIVRQWFEIVIQCIWVSRAHSNLKTIFCSTTGQQATGLSWFFVKNPQISHVCRFLWTFFYKTSWSHRQYHSSLMHFLCLKVSNQQNKCMRPEFQNRRDMTRT